MMQSHKKLDAATIRFRRRSDGQELQLTLYSPNACVLGDSGIGKTCFFE